MLKNIFILLLLGNLLFADFKTMNTHDVKTEIRKGTTIIDIRRKDEWNKYGIIKGSHKLTFFDDKGKYDINKWMEEFIKIVKNKEQKFILVCAHANRTKVVGGFLSKQLRYQNAFELDGGINYGWIDKGLQTVK